jgi:uncharacterized repeat protein (TIGR01451 family)
LPDYADFAGMRQEQKNGTNGNTVKSVLFFQIGKIILIVFTGTADITERSPYPKDEGMMKICKFVWFSMTLLWLTAGTLSVYAGQTVLMVNVDGAESPSMTILGQNEPAEKAEKKPLGLGERFKRFFSNLAKSEDEETNSPPADSGTKPSPTSIPTKPPKPPTAAEVQQSVEHPEKPVNDRRPAAVAQELQVSNSRAVSVRSIEMPPEPEASEDSIFQRLKEIRTQVFDRQTLRENRSYPPPVPAGTHTSAHSATVPPSHRIPPPESALENNVKAAQQLPPVYEKNITEKVPEKISERTAAGSNGQPLPLNIPKPEAVPERAMPEQALSEQVLPEPEQLVDKDIPYSPYSQKTASLSGVDTNPVNTGSTTARLNDTQAVRLNDGEAVRLNNNNKKEEKEEYQVANRRMLTEEHPLSEPVRMTAQVPVSEKKVLVSPRLEVETECPPKAIVGQETVYRIRVANQGGASAEQVVLSVEIPDWLEILQPDVSAGTTSIVPRSGQNAPRDFVWKISRVEPNAEELLVLHLVPQQRKSVDLRIKYDFYRPQTIAKIVVQEPVVEMELQGPDEVIWGNKVQYKLVVRNTGNGDAENIMLELLQTGSDMRTCPLPVLKAGEEQPIEVLVWTGKQEHIDINIQATGKYGLKSNVSKRVKVLRPNVIMTVEAPAVQFVGNPAEFQVKVQNEGDAAANELTLTAALPLGAQYVSCSDGGELTPENQIIWKIESIPVGESFSAAVVCLPKREGNCKLETTVNDKSGTLAQCSGSLESQAIVDLKLDVEYPQGPVEVGSEAVYTINVINRGTKAAENVEVTTAFADGVEPRAVEGGNAYMNNGQVFFDKITTMTAGQKIALKIKTRADEPGNHRVRTVVVCPGANINLVNEQATYFYKKQKEKSKTFVSTDVPSEPKIEKQEPQQSVREPNPVRDTEKKQETKVASKTAAPVEVKPIVPEVSGKQAPLDPAQPLPKLSDPFLE